ncbi:Acyl transferase/acyl hydrolase/lysophospholipase [Penicillium pulvis]|uniref:Acyl transferase/acyl hydrolase/lysophospholipase n=1 Tax=Penicillium pulvis TaxID=1562058 RepID=UPI002547549B|nr:Acyl transferase/acyl hydrolase/lysophospholipase [Penicillium pulvis]KAJ5784606.1 Acyl transferase/acyl hydrolase/lysophospholipase [Penicillium pulvis]
MSKNAQMGGEPIAIVGSACRFPGDATSPSKLWELLKEPRDVLTEIPRSRFNPDAFYHPDSSHHGTSNVRHSYVLSDDHRLFDAQFFGTKPVEANAIDPQQRLLLETVYESLESAGLPMEKLQGSDTGVYVGLMTNDYADLLGRDIQNIPAYFASGTARSILSNRISYFFNWHGPSMTIDTACSSSLVAMHQAVQSLRAGETRIAVAAGTNLLLGPEQYVAESKLKMLSPTGRSRMWDKDADGYARGDGIAVVVLKPLSTALADGDHIECVIRETGTNQDGRTKGITMPNPHAQADLIRSTYSRAGLDITRFIDRPQYFEAHGTGTPAGDPVEAEAISTAFFGPQADYFRKSEEEPPLFVGSIKTVIGHTEGTAGLAAVLKASLALQHGVVPPNLLLNELNPAVEPFCNDLQIIKKAQDWPKLPDNAVRRASVNSFGFGGANAHAILESFENTKGSTRTHSTSPPLTPFNFSASSENSLSATLVRYSDYLKGQAHVNLRDLSWTLNCRRSTLPVRVTISASNATDLITKLDRAAQSPIEFAPASKTQSIKQPKLLGIFTGQGAQWARMGAELLGSTLGAECIASLDFALQNLPRDHRPSWLLKDEILKDAASSRIREALFSQSLCTAIQIMLVDLLRAAGIVFTAVVGHSSGEISAAYAAGYLTAEDAIKIAYYRGWALQYSADINGVKGAMMAAGTSIEDARELCDMPTLEGRICIAASNSSASVTLSGDLDAIEEAKEVFDDEKKFARLLKVDKAYHSHHMLPCAAPYIEALQNCRIRIQNRSDIATTWISSVYGKNIETVNDSLVDTYWSNNMVNPVLFSQAVSYATAALGPFDMALEVGPHPALKGPALATIQEVSGNEVPYTGTCNRGKDSREAFASALGAIWISLGENAVDFAKFDNNVLPNGPRRLVKGLPTYSWDHDRIYWHESRISTAFRDGSEKFHSLLGVKCPDGTQKEIRWRNYLNTREIPWLTHHQVQGQIVFPAAGYISAAVELLIERYEISSIKLIELQDFIIGQALVLEENVGVEIVYALKISDEQEGSVTGAFNCYSDANKGSAFMSLHASANIKVSLGKPSHRELPLGSGHQGSFLEVETDRFYNFVSDLGFGYTGPFHALSNLKRKMDHAIGAIAVPIEDSTERPLLIHPGSLDGAIQAIMLAYSFPGDGRLRTLYLPTKIDSIRINPTLALELGGPGSELPFYSSVASARFSELSGDVDLYSSDGQCTVVQLEGLHTTPLTPLTVTTDVPMFTEIQWAPEEPTGAEVDVEVDLHDQADILAMERVAHFYLKNLQLSVGETEIPVLAAHHAHLLSYSSHCASIVKSNEHPWVPSRFSDDTATDISRVLSRYPESIDMEIMRRVGEALPLIVRGQVNLLEVLMQDNMLSQFYSEASGIQLYLKQVSNICGQISNRYPHLNVLEIGAGAGEHTEWILHGLNQGFASYTYTDILDSQFDEAQDKFQKHHAKMTFKVLDIEKDIAEQGYGQESFDLVIASLALYATSSIEATLSNVRRLIKPGGYLLLLELTNPNVMRFGLIFGGLPAWWMGHSDGRTLSPCVSTEKWIQCMEKVGFSGSDVSISCQQGSPVPFSVMLTQAVDQRVRLLRDPLAPTNETLGIESLTIIGGQSSFTTSLVLNVREAISNHYGKIMLYPSLADLSLTDLRVMGSVLCLSELDEPALMSMSRQTLKAFKALFEKSKNILWVGYGAQGDNPSANMIVGVQRTLQVEMPHLRMQFMNLHSLQDARSDLIARKLLQLDATDTLEGKGQLQEILWYREPQITLRNGKFFIPRLKLHTERNERYNSSRRLIVNSVPRETSVVVVDKFDGYYRVLKGKYSCSAFSHSSVQIQVTNSLLRPIMINETDHLFLVTGKECETGADVVAFSESLGSCIHIPTSWRVQCGSSKGEPLQSMVCLYSHFIAQALLKDVIPGSTIAVLEPDFALAAVLTQHATRRGIRMALFTTENRSCSQPWIFIHRHSARRDMMANIPPNVVKLFNFAGDQNVLSRLRDGLPDECRLETERTLTMQYSHYSTSSTGADGVGSQLQNLWFKVQMEQSPVNVNRLPSFTLTSLINSQPSTDKQALLTWENENLPLQVFPATSIVRFDQSKTYWLVGLAGGLGLSLCHWMARQGARYIALSSRNPKVDAAWIMQMAESGCTVRVFANDVTNRESVASTYNEIANTMPRIGGVAQGAMVLQDTMFLDLDLPGLEKVLRPKIQGSILLDELFPEDTLDFMIFFSSMAAITGNPGQVAYNAANMFMASLAAQRRNRGLAGYAINIGAIVGNGYVTRELSMDQQSYLYRVGHTWMSEQDFREVFAEGVLSCIERTGDSELCSSLRIDEDESKNWIANPVFQHLVVKSNPFAVTNKKNKSGVLARLQLLDATSHAEVLEILQDAFTIKLRSALQTDPDKEILDLSPDELGVDSLVAVDLRSWFIKEVSIDMPVLKIFNAASVRDLLESAACLLPDTLIPNVNNDEEAVSNAPVAMLPRSTQISPPEPESAQNIPISEYSDEAKVLHLEYAPSNDVGSASSATSARAGDSTSEQGDETSSSASSVESFTDEGFDQKRQIQRTLPMSHGQSRFYFLKSFVEDQTAFNVTPVFEVTGHLRIDDLARAVEKVGQHHEALRTFFFLDQDKQGMQGVWTKSSLRLERFQISHEKEVEAFKGRMGSYVFKIEDGETLRIQLLSLRGDKHWLICGFHHINMDGISFEIFWSDLEKAYKGQSLSYDMLQYPDFTLRQLNDHETGAWEKSLEYWREEFTDIPPVAPLLPFSRLPARPNVSGIGTHNAHMRLGKGLSDEIRKCAAMFKATPYHLHLAIWQTLLLRLFDVEDICIGLGDGNRTDPDVMQSIGLFLNLVPIRFHRKPSQSFGEALKDTKSISQQAFSHAHVPLSVILSDVSVPRSTTHSPLFQVSFNYRPGIAESRTFCGCIASGSLLTTGGISYDLHLDVVDIGGGETSIYLLAQKDLYELQHAEILLRSYYSLLRAFIQNPATRVFWPPLFSTDDVDEGLAVGRGLEMENPWSETLVHRISEVSASYPNHVALREPGGAELTYSRFSSRVSSIAIELLQKGIHPGDTVGVFQSPGVNWICSMMAIWQVGGTYVPLDRKSGTDRLSTIISETAPRVILIDASTGQDFGQLHTSVKPLDVSCLREHPGTPAPNLAKATQLAVVMYTSGSTGVPKGIMINHSAFSNQIQAFSQAWGIREGKEVVLHQSSYAWDMSICQILLSLSNAGTLIIADAQHRLSPAALASLIQSENVTTTVATPTEYFSWIRHGGLQLKETQWSLAVSGGESVSKALMHEFQCLAKLELTLINAYGPAEATMACSSAEIPYMDIDIAAEDRSLALYTLPNNSVYIVDEKLNPVPIGMPGELVIGGAGVAMGYLDADKNRERFTTDRHASSFFQGQGWTNIHRTGDRAQLTEDGGLVLMGRISGDNQIKLNGIRINVEEIEAAILRDAKGRVLQVVVSPRSSTEEPSRNFVVAFVVVVDFETIEMQTEFLEHLAQDLALPQYMLPAAIIPIDALPQNISGKADRSAIKSLVIPQNPRQEAKREDLLPLEASLRQLWQETIPRDVVSHHSIQSQSEYFHCGGSSLSLVTLQSLIKERLDVTVSLHQLFEASTLHDMASLIGKQSTVNIGASVDWEKEIDELLASSQDTYPKLSDQNSPSKSSVVVLTGATGFIGKEILRNLLDDENVQAVHCLAVRSLSAGLPDIFSHPKVRTYGGDLGAPRLGLADSDAVSIFSCADVIVHNGADVSFMKTYQSLKLTNVASTKELAKLALPRRIPFHFISSATVTRLACLPSFGESSLACYSPSAIPDDGYMAAKWVCEVYLERVSRQFGLPVWIHRPSSVSGADAPQLDLMSNIMRYCQETKSIPDTKSWPGGFDLISVDSVAEQIVDAVHESGLSAGCEDVRFRYESGELELGQEEVQEVMEAGTGEKFEVVSVAEWVDLAEKAGMSALLGMYLRKATDGQVLLPRLIKGKR